MRQYGWQPYKSLPENEQQLLVECKQNIIKREKMSYYNYKKLLSKKRMT